MGERRKYVRRDATVERLSAIFLEDMVGSVKPSTLACYRRNIQCHILPALGECVAAELTAAEINDYIQQLQEDYSPKLVREIGGLLLRIVGMAGVGYGEDVTLPKVRQKAVEVFTEPELKQMGQVILRRPDRTGLGVLLTAYTGLRLGELCGLQWQDVDVGAGLLHIQRTVERIAQIGGGTCLTVQPPKTENSERWIPIPKEVRQKAVEVFTEPELKQMGQVILRRPDRTGLGVLLTAYTGLRLGELCGLQWQDVDVGAGLLHIQRTVERIAQIGGGTCLTVQPPKTENSERWIPIPKEMLRMLKPETKQPDSYLLTGGEIVPDPRAMQYRYKVLLERCGVRYRNFHCLRHSYATRCVERGVDVKSVSELLGHADVRTTLRLYVHSSMDYKRRAVEGIGFLKGIT